MPVPGTTSPQPSPFVHVTAHAQPSASAAEMCVVAPSRLAVKRSRKPGSGRPARNSGVRSACAASIASTIAATDGGDGARSSSASA